MAAYMGRLVEHYTAGGHHDSCGHWHPSGFFYNWTILSVLNEGLFFQFSALHKGT